MFEPKKLHNGELYDLYNSPYIIRVTKTRRMRWVGHVAYMCAYKVLVGNPEGTRDNIKIDLK